jgi:hypothetical protein
MDVPMIDEITKIRFYMICNGIEAFKFGLALFILGIF